MSINQTTVRNSTEGQLAYVPAHIGTSAFLLGLDYANPATPGQVTTVARLTRTFIVPPKDRSALASAWSEAAGKLGTSTLDDTDEAIEEAGLTASAILAQKSSNNGSAEHDDSGADVAGIIAAGALDQSTGAGETAQS